MSSARWPAYSAIAGFFTVAFVCLVALSLQGPSRAPAEPATQLRQVRAIAPPVVIARALPPADSYPASEAGHYDQLRARLRWVQTRVGNEKLLTPDLHSRMLLAKSAAKRAGLSEVGLSFADVYGIINAETSWVPRNGASKDGTPNLGIAQFEPATARALGVRNPHDPVEAVHAAAAHMKEAALWSRERLQSQRLAPAERADKLREGVSVYYNLSTRGRNAWNGSNSDRLPVETQRHIQNTRLGAQEALFADARLRAIEAPRQGGMMTASSSGDNGS